MPSPSDLLPPALKQRVTDAFWEEYKKNFTKDQEGKTKEQFFDWTIKKFIKDTVKAWESKDASEKARVTAITKAEAEINV